MRQHGIQARPLRRNRVGCLTGKGWHYLAVILDLFTRKVISSAMRDHMRAELTIAGLSIPRRQGSFIILTTAANTLPAATSTFCRPAGSPIKEPKINAGTMPGWKVSSPCWPSSFTTASASRS
jgi:hypothetical protein